MTSIRYIVAPAAIRQLEEHASRLETLSEGAGERLVSVMERELSFLCLRIAEGFRPQPNESASIALSHPVFQHLVRTGQQRSRRSSQGTWRVFYDLAGARASETPELLRVVTIRHASAPPLWEEPREGDEN